MSWGFLLIWNVLIFTKALSAVKYTLKTYWYLSRRLNLASRSRDQEKLSFLSTAFIILCLQKCFNIAGAIPFCPLRARDHLQLFEIGLVNIMLAFVLADIQQCVIPFLFWGMQLSWVSGAQAMTLWSPMLTSVSDLKVQIEMIRDSCLLTEVIES